MFKKNLMIPDYIIDSKYAILNRFMIELEYNSEKSIKYVQVSPTEISNKNATDKAYAYGILSNINYSDFVVLDVDNIITEFNYIYKNEFQKISFENKLEALVQYIKLLPNEFENVRIERIDVFKSSTEYHTTWINSNFFEPTFLGKLPVHIYIKFNKVFNVESFYRHYYIVQMICKGYLTFINYNNYSNIRITEKYNYIEPRPFKKFDTKIIPLFSMVHNKIIKYPEYIKLHGEYK